MQKIGVAIGEEMWTFFNAIYRDLALSYEVSVFQKKEYYFPLLYGRLNRWSYRQGMKNFLKFNDICFFEWASEHLMTASHLNSKKPIVTRLHSFELYDWAPKINWDAVDKIILVSEFIQKEFNMNYPTQSHKTIVINNGKSLDIFKPPTLRTFSHTIGMLGSIIPVKRVYEIILVLYDLVKIGLPITLRIAGEPKANSDARYPIAINNLVKNLGLEKHVLFDGFIKDTQIWLQNIDIFISNSFWEGQQVALIEAMACGCYCLSHIWNGAEEMLPNENLFITNFELEQKIIDFYNLPDDEKIILGMNLRTLATKKYDITHTKNQIRQVISDIFQIQRK